MSFLSSSNTKIAFINFELTLKFYVTIKTLLATYQVEIINRKKFAKILLNENLKMFIIYIASFSLGLIQLVKKL